MGTYRGMNYEILPDGRRSVNCCAWVHTQAEIEAIIDAMLDA